MRALAISSTPPPDRTLAVALAIVGVFGTVQLVSVHRANLNYEKLAKALLELARQVLADKNKH